MKRFTLSVPQKSAEGKVDHAVGEDNEALQCRKAEQPIGRAGNDDRRPERYPARGIKGRASKQCDLGDGAGKKPNRFGLPGARWGEAPGGRQGGDKFFPGRPPIKTPGFSPFS